MLALMLSALDQNIVGPALPKIVSEFGGLSRLSWVVTAFLLASTSTTPLYGKLSDIYGRRALFNVAIGLFLSGSVLCGLACSLEQLILFRALQGLGAGGLMTLAQTTIADLIPPRDRGRYQGLFGSVFAACSVAGPLLGGIITDRLNWRWIFYVNLPVGAAALFLIAKGLNYAARPNTVKVDYLGAGLLALMTTSLLLVFSWGGTVYPWLARPMQALMVCSALTLGALVYHVLHTSDPILPPRLFSSRVVLISTLIVSLNATALYNAMVFLPLYFQLVLGQSASESGLLMAPMMLGLIFGSAGGGRLVSRTGKYKALTNLGLLLSTAMLIYLSWCSGQTHSVMPVVGGLVGLGFSLGLVMPTMTVAIQNAVDPRDLGVATSTSAYFRSLGGALGAAVAGVCLALGLRYFLTNLSGLPSVRTEVLAATNIVQLSELPPDSQELLRAAYRFAISHNFWISTSVCTAALMLSLFLPEIELRARSLPEPAKS